jgi:hypothetical protein
MKIPTIFTSLAGTQVVQNQQVPCVPDSQERRSAGDTSKVNQQLRAVLFRKMKDGVTHDEHSLAALSPARPDTAESNRLGSDDPR